MNREQQVLSIIKKLKENKPAKVFKKVSNDLDSGMRFVLMYLNNETDKVYASNISEVMDISRARVGKLLDKMVDKGLITKNNSDNDARIININLTEKGIVRCNEILQEISIYISRIIDNIGYEEFNKFLDTACKIKEVLEEGGYLD